MQDINIYVPLVDDTQITNWQNRFQDAQMEVEICPGFSFLSQSGLLPFKVVFPNTSIPHLLNKMWVTGFEYYIDDYDFSKEYEEFVQLLEEGDEAYLSTRDIDNILKQCTKQILLSWSPSHDSLEFRMAHLSTVIILEMFGGVAFNPHENLWYQKDGLFDKFLQDINDFESDLEPQEWILHEFEKWM